MRDPFAMRRVTVRLSEDLDAALRLEARRLGVSMAHVVRQLLQARLGGRADGRNLSFVAVGEGDGATVDVDEVVGRAIQTHKAPWLTGR
jgi:plasmid stability protein